MPRLLVLHEGHNGGRGRYGQPGEGPDVAPQPAGYDHRRTHHRTDPLSAMRNLQVIAFDADDTLWDCQSYFEAVEKKLYGLIAPYCDDPAKELFVTESGNMADLGYGCKAFTISVLETALRVGGSHLTTSQLSDLLTVSKALLHLPATPLPGVEHTEDMEHERLTKIDHIEQLLPLLGVD